MHLPAHFALTALCLVPGIVAQSVGASLRAPTPLQVTARSGAVVDTQGLPAGPLPASGLLEAFTQAGGPTASAVHQWQLTSGVTGVELVLSNGLSIDAGAGGALGECSTGPNDFVLDLTPTGAAGVPAIVSVQSLRSASPGFPSPTYEIDVGDDGSIEFLGTFAGAGTVPLTFGTATVPIRIRLAGQHAATQGNHAASDTIRLSVTPQNFLAIQPAVYGCETASAFLLPAFPQSGVLFRIGIAAGPAVAVFGLGVQPVLLPNSGALQPCLLIPSPDLVVLIPPAGQLLGIPAAVRPVTIYVQGVLLLPTGLGTSNGFIVQG